MKWEIDHLSNTPVGDKCLKHKPVVRTELDDMRDYCTISTVSSVMRHKGL
jgi:hypothetical protein